MKLLHSQKICFRWKEIENSFEVSVSGKKAKKSKEEKKIDKQLWGREKFSLFGSRTRQFVEQQVKSRKIHSLHEHTHKLMASRVEKSIAR